MFDRRAFLSFSLVPFAYSKRVAAAQDTAADWRLVSSSSLIEARWDHTLSALPGSSELLVAFGRNGSGAPLGDAWIADRSDGDWELIESPGPSPRFGHAVATDIDRGKVYLFGGQADGDTFFADLWSFDTASRTWELMHNGAGGPPARYGTALVFDGDASLFVLHGFTFEGRFDDVWRFDLNSATWQQLPITSSTAPLRRCLHEAVWVKSRNRIYLYGGCSSGYGPCPQGDLWELDPASGAWREIGSGAPAGRMNPALVMDDRAERFVLMGGLTADGASSELWVGELNGNDVWWSTVEPDATFPSARSSHDAVLSGGAIYLFGGLSVDGATADLWRLKLPELD